MRAPDHHWAALVKLLPKGTDVALFEEELECIKANTVIELERQRNDCRDLIRLCDEIIKWRMPFAQEAIAFRDDCQKRVGLISLHIRRWKRGQCFELLDLAERVGADLGYISKGELPHGPGIDYLQHAAATIDIAIDADGVRHHLQLWKRRRLRASLRGEGRLIANVTVMRDGKIVEP
jgi:hypothetical protein